MSTETKTQQPPSGAARSRTDIRAGRYWPSNGRPPGTAVCANPECRTQFDVSEKAQDLAESGVRRTGGPLCCSKRCQHMIVKIGRAAAAAVTRDDRSPRGR